MVVNRPAVTLDSVLHINQSCYNHHIKNLVKNIQKNHCRIFNIQLDSFYLLHKTCYASIIMQSRSDSLTLLNKPCSEKAIPLKHPPKCQHNYIVTVRQPDTDFNAIVHFSSWPNTQILTVTFCQRTFQPHYQTVVGHHILGSMPAQC